MAKSTFMGALMLMILLVLLTVHVSGREQLHYESAHKSTMRKRIDSDAILRELGYDHLSKVRRFSRRSLKEPDRRAPGGPDPQHNAGPPGSY